MIINIFCKVIQILLKARGKGSSFPGKLALKLDKNFLGKFKLPEIIVFVTGSVGKSTITGTVVEILKNNNYKVATNSTRLKSILWCSINPDR